MKDVFLKAGLTALAAAAAGLLAALHIHTRATVGEPFTPLLAVAVALAAACTAFLFSLTVFARNHRLAQELEMLTHAHARLEAKTRTDHLTGLSNREHFYRMLKSSRRKSEIRSLLIIDADHFKKINDRHGHLVGDKALMKISQALCRAVRANDIVARIGGEEFGIILINADAHETLEVAERIRREVECIEFIASDGSKVPLTVSIGGAAEIGGQPASFLMREADFCLYQAKNRGRNRAVIQPLAQEKHPHDTRQGVAPGETKVLPDCRGTLPAARH
ncbi:GGDEF domain-containing protein [Nitratireductor sp. GCM10026969]|uniref:GGDEF domain-containing protein n=1 Tax=Nitratireductor sp. GCM10026969 TaxID=3252645 RepID=UPI00360C8B53